MDQGKGKLSTLTHASIITNQPPFKITFENDGTTSLVLQIVYIWDKIGDSTKALLQKGNTCNHDPLFKRLLVEVMGSKKRQWRQVSPLK
jgi:hypothetical protein